MKYIFADNLLSSNEKSFDELFSQIINYNSLQIVDQGNKEEVRNNLKRCEGIQKFKKGEVEEAIEIHKKLMKEAEEQ